MPIRDVYLLQRSEQFHLPPRGDATIDLCLKKAPVFPDTKLTGMVISCGTAVSGATVQIFNHKDCLVAQTTTDSKGRFFFIKKVWPGEYYLIASAGGYKTSKEYPIFLSMESEFYVSIKLPPSNLICSGTIYGVVLDDIGQKLSYAKVVISDYNNVHSIKAITKSTVQGDYLVYGLKPGKYLISAFKEGYSAPSPISFDISVKEILGIDISLYEVISSRVGSISGTVCHNGQEYPYATAALYKIEENKQILVEIKEANGNGDYLFTDIPPGKYVVKSKIENIDRICNEVCIR